MGLFDIAFHKWLRVPYLLAATDTGEGKKTVVLLHGLAASGAVWWSLRAQLEASGWRVIVPDLLGFGDSPKPQWAQYAVRDHARQVVALLRARNVRGPVVLVGHSMGCLVATHIAATYPRLVKRLVLYEPPLYADDPEFRKHMRQREYYFALYEFIAAHPQLAFVRAQLLWRIAKRLVGLQITEEMWAPFQRSLRNTIMQQTAYKELHDINLSTDIVHGRFDIIVAKRELRKMYKSNPHITWHTVSDVHGISQRSAKYLAALLNQVVPKRKARKVKSHLTGTIKRKRA
jgi:pimeloyl-ACP methyl ester carboxylesterase